MDSLLVGSAVSTISALLLSSVLMLACCKKKKPRQIPQQQLPQNPNVLPPPTQLQCKPAKGKKTKKPPPNVREDQPRAAGVGVGLDYQTLGNLDKNIFVKGQKQKEGGKAKTTPSVPAQDQKPPAGVDEVPQKEGLAAGGDYQTMADIDQNVFGAKGGDAGAPPPPAAPGGPGPSSQTSQKEAAPKEGIGQGADYQTWNNLDQNVFAKKDGAKSSADKKSAAGAGSGSQKEAAPKEGIGAGADYQTWNSMDKDVFLKGKKPDDDKKSAAGKGSEASKAEEAPRAGIGQGQDYQTWNALDKDVFVKK